MLPVGSSAPQFTLPDSSGRKRSLRALLQRGPLILYFYPADFSPGCTKEACSLRDLHDDVLKAGLRIVGVSPQSPDSHAHFSEKFKLPFTLLSDEDKAVIRAYDVDGPLGVSVRRATFLIDQKGMIEDAVIADLMMSRHEAFVRKAAELARPKPRASSQRARRS
jgi:thioredoxin-dependent peroxiredoxin